MLFFAFWVYLGLKALKGLNNKINYPLSVTAILIIIFFLVECTSDSTITHNRGLFMMMLLALSLSDLKRNLQEESVHESSNS